MRTPAPAVLLAVVVVLSVVTAAQAPAEPSLESLRAAAQARMREDRARFSADAAAMGPFLAELGKRGLLYFDDGSTARSVARAGGESPSSRRVATARFPSTGRLQSTILPALFARIGGACPMTPAHMVLSALTYQRPFGNGRPSSSATGIDFAGAVTAHGGSGAATS